MKQHYCSSLPALALFYRGLSKIHVIMMKHIYFVALVRVPGLAI